MWSHKTHKIGWQDGMYFMINNAIKMNDAVRNGKFGRYGGASDMCVDWVRMYERK